MNNDPYIILGVSRDADPKTIKSAYRKLAKQYHPDISKEVNAEEKFREIAEAYDILSDEEKKRRYDTTGRTDSQNFNQQYSNGQYYKGYSTTDMQFKRFKDLSLVTRIILILVGIVLSAFIIVGALIFFAVRLIISILNAIFK